MSSIHHVIMLLIKQILCVCVCVCVYVYVYVCAHAICKGKGSRIQFGHILVNMIDIQDSLNLDHNINYTQ